MAGAVPVNHHADHPGFVGVTGLLAGLTMSASVGETVLVSGKGFGASEIVDILVGAETVASPRTSPSGEFAIVSVVPFPRPYASQVNVTATGRGTIKSARAPLKITIRAG